METSSPPGRRLTSGEETLHEATLVAGRGRLSVYVRSFANFDGDGLGDLCGVTERLDYVECLGVDGLWLNPCYPLPGTDQGYDVSDYTTVDPVYGGMPAFEALVEELRRQSQ